MSIVPRVGRDGAEEHQQRRRLAGAVRPEEADALAGLDDEVDAVDGADRPEGLLQAARLEHRPHGWSRLGGARPGGRLSFRQTGSYSAGRSPPHGPPSACQARRDNGGSAEPRLPAIHPDAGGTVAPADVRLEPLTYQGAPGNEDPRWPQSRRRSTDRSWSRRTGPSWLPSSTRWAARPRRGPRRPTSSTRSCARRRRRPRPATATRRPWRRPSSRSTPGRRCPSPRSASPRASAPTRRHRPSGSSSSARSPSPPPPPPRRPRPPRPTAAATTLRRERP